MGIDAVCFAIILQKQKIVSPPLQLRSRKISPVKKRKPSNVHNQKKRNFESSLSNSASVIQQAAPALRFTLYDERLLPSCLFTTYMHSYFQAFQ